MSFLQRTAKDASKIKRFAVSGLTPLLHKLASCEAHEGVQPVVDMSMANHLRGICIMLNVAAHS
jgi:hypothetical protein